MSTTLVINGGCRDVEGGKVDTGTSTLLSFRALMALLIACGPDTKIANFRAGRTVYAAVGDLTLGDLVFAGAPVVWNNSIPDDTIIAFDEVGVEKARLSGITG